MQIRHLKSVIPAADGPNRITALAWSPNNQKLAFAGADRVIQLFDETGERKDRFATKPADPKNTGGAGGGENGGPQNPSNRYV